MVALPPQFGHHSLWSSEMTPDWQDTLWPGPKWWLLPAKEVYIRWFPFPKLRARSKENGLASMTPDMCLIPRFPVSEWLRWDCSSRMVINCACPRVIWSAFYLVGFLPVLPWAEDGKWEGAGAGRLWSSLLIYTPLPRLSVLCEAGKLWVCGSPALVFFSPLQVGGPYISHLPAWKAIRADLQRTVFLINWRIHRAYSYSQEQGCHQKRI